MDLPCHLSPNKLLLAVSEDAQEKVHHAALTALAIIHIIQIYSGKEQFSCYKLLINMQIRQIEALSQLYSLFYNANALHITLCTLI